MDRYDQNRGVFSLNDMDVFQKKTVMIVGLGGLGGYLANSLVRLGFSDFILVDHDHFTQSNLNRQVFCTEKTVGMKKTDVTKNALLDIHHAVRIDTFDQRIETLDMSMLRKPDVLFDAVDSPNVKCYLEQFAHQLNIPLVHGAIGGWYGQLGILLPNVNRLESLYHLHEQGMENDLKSPTFTPAIIANMMVLEYAKYLTCPKDALVNKILFCDTLNHEYRVLFEEEESR